MKEKRYVRAIIVALTAACIGLLLCISAFYLFWARSSVVRLLPAVLFGAFLVLALIFFSVKKLLTTRK